MTLLLMLLAASPLEVAKGHLAKGQLDDVVFDLDGQKLSATEQPEAVKVLAAASKGALAKSDAVLALHLAGMGLKLDPKSAACLEAASRAAFAQQMFEDAERHCDAWISVDPKSQAARLLRAQLATEAGEWDKVLEQVRVGKLDSPEAKKLEQRAQAEKTERTQALTELTSIAKAMDEAAKRPAQRPAAEQQFKTQPQVVVYGTSWCGYCKKAREWLTRKGVTFVDRDIEKDQDAAMELARKAAAAGVRPTGVPVIDVKGTLVLGFDPAQIEQAL